MKKLLGIIALWMMLFAVSALGEEAPKERILAAENDRLSLYVAADCCSVDIEDRLTGRVWSSTMNDETAADIKIIPAQKKKISSLLSINCTNLKTGLGVVNNVALVAEKKLEASMELIDGGVRLTYYLGTYQVGLSTEITLDGASLLCAISPDSIREDGEYSLVSVDMMPYLFSATDLAEGYFLYPDGCGAVMEFRDNAHYKEPTRLYKVYGDYGRQQELIDTFEEESPVVPMPVFGMNRGGRGMLAVIESGAETTRVSLNCSNNIIGLNYLFASFQYRRSFSDKRVKSREIKVYDRERIITDYRLRILFMEEENPTYSDMACTWRSYLLEKGLASRTEQKARVAVDLFMTAPEEGLLFDTPRTVTTLSQAAEILKALDGAGVGPIRASVKGWSRAGYGKTPDSFPLNGTIGGDGDLKNLIETAHSLGATVSLTADFLSASSDQGGYSHRNDVVYTGNHAILTDEEETFFALSTDVASEKLTAFLRKAEGFDLDAVRFQRMGLVVGYNYGNRRYITAAQSLEYYRGMLKSVADTFGAAEAEGGNACLLGYADFFTRVPMKDFGYQATTCSVPFYQIALHGLVQYTGEPGNLSSDLDREVLRWVEMGYTPCFELTWQNTEELMYTNYQSLFSAEYSAWLERVAAAAEQFTRGDLAELCGEFILKHERLSATLVKVTYESGRAVYVNYGSEAARDGDTEIPARAWIVTGPESGT